MVQVSRHPSSIEFYGKIMKVNLNLDLHVRKFKTVVLQFWLCYMTLNLNSYLSMQSLKFSHFIALSCVVNIAFQS
jgi:hypothetical protein